MKKKRFIKLMMARGVPRNEAMTIARSHNKIGNSYECAYVNFFVRVHCPKLVICLSAALGRRGVACAESALGLIKLYEVSPDTNEEKQYETPWPKLNPCLNCEAVNNGNADT